MCTVAYTGQVTLYKVPEKHGYVYVVGLNMKFTQLILFSIYPLVEKDSIMYLPKITDFMIIAKNIERTNRYKYI